MPWQCPTLLQLGKRMAWMKTSLNSGGEIAGGEDAPAWPGLTVKGTWGAAGAHSAVGTWCSGNLHPWADLALSMGQHSLEPQDRSVTAHLVCGKHCLTVITIYLGLFAFSCNFCQQAVSLSGPNKMHQEQYEYISSKIRWKSSQHF